VKHSAWEVRALSYFKTGEYHRAESDQNEYTRLGGTPDPTLVRRIETELKFEGLKEEKQEH